MGQMTDGLTSNVGEMSLLDWAHSGFSIRGVAEPTDKEREIVRNNTIQLKEAYAKAYEERQEAIRRAEAETQRRKEERRRWLGL